MKIYKKETYTGQYGPYDYYVIPKEEYSYELECKLNDIPFMLSEYRSFYLTRFDRINFTMKPFHENKWYSPNTINVPIITKEECHKFGL